ncbi:MAG TPA: xanthine dehydrogenase family protein molybdopterin-binding subunit [Bacillota bacterium]|nr:xanthine dehydrogenase family protein molybdopterin-binding subunit [Bacillota bacterium]
MAREAYIGVGVRRNDALGKVTGAARYAGDLKFPGMLYVKLLRSPYAHARIVRIDTSKAQELPGVKAVVTGKDFPYRMGLYLKDRTPYAIDKVRYYGEPVAGVAAESVEVAEKALELIEVEYEELPCVLDIREAIKPDACLVHPDLHTYEIGPAFYPVPHTNISNHFRIRKGDLEKGFAEADLIVEGEYWVPHIQHSPIEPHAAIALYDHNCKLTMWASSQSPFAMRSILSQSLGIPMNKVRVIAPYVGGGFGGKAGLNVEATLVPLAMKCKGRPVKLVCTREEEFRDTFVRQGMLCRLKTGVKRNGRITAQEFEMYWDAGAYTEYGVNVTRAAGYSSSGVYDIPNMKTDSYCVYTNKPVGGPLRGFGHGENHWAMEQHIDRIAHELGMDPVEVRRVNLQRDGSTNATGQVLRNPGIEQCLEKAVELIGWEEVTGPGVVKPGTKKVRAKGIACMTKAPAMPNDAASSALIKVNDDGTVYLSIGAQELGQGSFTALAQIAANELGVRYEDVKVLPVDTDTSAYEWQTVASRITFSCGRAVMAAAQDARRQVLDHASKYFGVPVEDIDIADSMVFVKSDPKRSVHIGQLSLGVTLPDYSGYGGPIIGRGKFIPEGISAMDPETGQSEKPVANWTYGAQAVEIELDVETGKIDVLKVVAVYDAGRVINPITASTQVEGGVVQGISIGLLEELKFDEQGKLLNPSYIDYKISTAADIPRELLVDFVEVPQEDGPYGARGIGEHVMVPTPPAIANALYHAAGIRLTTLPMTSEKVYWALKERASASDR